jgi:hypothetical protein
MVIAYHDTKMKWKHLSVAGDTYQQLEHLLQNETYTSAGTVPLKDP